MIFSIFLNGGMKQDHGEFIQITNDYNFKEYHFLCRHANELHIGIYTYDDDVSNTVHYYIRDTDRYLLDLEI